MTAEGLLKLARASTVIPLGNVARVISSEPGSEDDNGLLKCVCWLMSAPGCFPLEYKSPARDFGVADMFVPSVVRVPV